MECDEDISSSDKAPFGKGEKACLRRSSEKISISEELRTRTYEVLRGQVPSRDRVSVRRSSFRRFSPDGVHEVPRNSKDHADRHDHGQ